MAIGGDDGGLSLYPYENRLKVPKVSAGCNQAWSGTTDSPNNWNLKHPLSFQKGPITKQTISQNTSAEM